jgi:DNA-binding SARP family transcriptional activator/tetratricopeptide (TPR) repeat protein
MTDSSRSPSHASLPIRICLLGPVTVKVGLAPLAVDTRKAIALLAYLAVTRRPASREAVAALLWPEADDPGARGALRRTLSVLRAGLGDRGLVVDRSAVGLDPSAIEVDIWRFEEALAVARGHEHPDGDLCPTCRGALREAVELDRGEFMAGFALRDSEDFDEWQLAEGTSYRRELAAVLERLARGEAAARDWAAASSAARRWLELDSLHEAAHRLLMEILARAGEPAAALAQYRDCVRVLDRELGVAPLSETSALAEDIRAGRLSGPPPALPATVNPASRTAAPVAFAPAALVGRDTEMALLIEAYQGVGPDGRLLLLEGEAGIGKTRLGSALADVVRSAGGTVLAARAYPGEAGIAFAPIVELIRTGLAMPEAAGRLRTVRPDHLAEAARLVSLPGVLAAAAAGSSSDPYGRARLLEALAEVVAALAAGPVPGLIRLDDIGGADDSTIELLGYVAHRLRGRPIALLVTARPEDLAADTRERLLGAADRDGLVVRIAPGRLGRSDVAVLAGFTLDGGAEDARIDTLFERSEGLPLYVVEALAAPGPAGDAIPGGVGALLRARLDSVGEVATQVLSAAAVIGRSFDLAMVRVASGRTDDETVDGLDEAVRQGLVREIGPGAGGDVQYDFTHGRLRDVAYDGLSLARRRLLHARVAGAVRATSSTALGSEVDLWALIARHETDAGRSTEAAEAHRRAGHLARFVFANAEAREHLEAALALGSGAVVEIHEALGEVLTLLGDYDGAIGHLEAAEALAGPADEASLEHRIGIVLARRGDWARAELRLVAALELMDPSDRSGLRSRILVERGVIACRVGDPAGAAALADAALALAGEAADPIAVARAEDLLGIVARNRGDLASARDHLERALAAIDSADATATAGNPATVMASLDLADPGVRIAALNTLALVCADGGDPERAIALTHEALILCERQGDRHRQAALENNLADLLHATGHPDESLDHLRRAVTFFAEVGGRPGELEPEIWKLVEW